MISLLTAQTKGFFRNILCVITIKRYDHLTEMIRN